MPDTDYPVTCQIEQDGEELINRFLKRFFEEVIPFPTDTVQELGDYTCISYKYGKRTVEVKNDTREVPENFFFESWSNKSSGKRGWAYKMKFDILIYYFQRAGDIYLMSHVNDLKKHLFTNNRIESYKEVPQTKYRQRNDSYGRLIPISELAQFGWCFRYRWFVLNPKK